MNDMVNLDDYLDDKYRFSKDELAKRLLAARTRILAPSPSLSLSEWAKEHGKLSSESSAEPGDFVAYGYQNGLMDMMSDPKYHTVAIMKAARVGYTQLAAFALGYYLEHDPTKVLFVLPTEDNVSDFVKDTIEPMLRDVESLAAISGTGVAKDDKLNRFTNKGSVLYLRGAFSADTFRRITSRINIGDEIDADGWGSAGAKSQGDKIRLLDTRGQTFWNKKLLLGSTPLIDGQSRIQKYYLRGNQMRYFVPCPHCGEMQTLEWGDGTGAGIDYQDKGTPEAPVYIGTCGCVIEEKHKEWMDANGEWRATAEGRPGVCSAHISTLYSLQPNATWAHLVAEWQEAQGDPDKLQPFKNLVLGEPWVDRSASLKEFRPHDLELRLVEDHDAELPDWVRLITFGVDTQSKDGGRFEVSFYGWGAGKRGIGLGHFIVPGPLSEQAAWDELTKLLARQWVRKDGRALRAKAGCIDSGSNLYTNDVYGYCEKHKARRWWAIKGHGTHGKGTRGKSIWPRHKSQSHFTIDVNLAKDAVYKKIHAEVDEEGVITYHAEPPSGSLSFDTEFFTRLTREKPVPVKNGVGTFWTDPPDQEPWDCMVYSYAALEGLLALVPGTEQKVRGKSGSMPKRPSQPRPPVAEEEAAPEEMQEATPQKAKPKRRPVRHKPQAKVSSWMRRN